MDVNLAAKGSFLESRQGHFLLILKRLFCHQDFSPPLTVTERLEVQDPA